MKISTDVEYWCFVVMSDLREIEIQNIDHLGIVAGIIDSIGLVEIINELIGQERGENISSLSGMRWLCRVPMTIGLAKEVISTLLSTDFIDIFYSSLLVEFFDDVHT